MAKKAPPSFDFYFNDWLGGTRRMSHVQQSCYLLLLIDQWQNGHIPTNYEERMRVCGIASSDEWLGIWERIKDKFEERILADGTRVLVNPRMEEDRDENLKKYRERVKRNQENGKKGGRPKKSQITQNEPSGLFLGFDIKPTSEEGRGKEEEGSLLSDSESSQKSKSNGGACSPPPPDVEASKPKKKPAAPPPVLSEFKIPLRGGEVFSVHQSVIDKAMAVYGWSMADVRHIVGKAELWCMTNKRKAPATDGNQFLAHWFAKEDEIRRRNPSLGATQAPTIDPASVRVPESLQSIQDDVTRWLGYLQRKLGSLDQETVREQLRAMVEQRNPIVVQAAIRVALKERWKRLFFDEARQTTAASPYQTLN